MRYTYCTLPAIFSLVNCLPRPSIQLRDNFDEPNEFGFCIDLKGWGENVNLNGVHLYSCKPDTKRILDQMFYPVNN